MLTYTLLLLSLFSGIRSCLLLFSLLSHFACFHSWYFFILPLFWTLTSILYLYCGEGGGAKSALVGAGDPALDGWFIHNRLTNSRSEDTMSLCWMPATRRYKIHLCDINTYEINIYSRRGGVRRMRRGGTGDTQLDGWVLHNQLTTFRSGGTTSLDSMPATRWYKVPLSRINTCVKLLSTLWGGVRRSLRGGEGDAELDG